MKKLIEVIGGRFEGQLYTGAQMSKRLSNLPGKDEMRAQFLAYSKLRCLKHWLLWKPS